MALTLGFAFPAYYPANATHSPPLVPGATSTVARKTTKPQSNVAIHYTWIEIDSCYGSNPYPFKHRTISKLSQSCRRIIPKRREQMTTIIHFIHVLWSRFTRRIGPIVPSPTPSRLHSHFSTTTSRGCSGLSPVRGTRTVSRAPPSAMPQQSWEADYHFPSPPRHTLLTFS